MRDKDRIDLKSVNNKKHTDFQRMKPTVFQSFLVGSIAGAGSAVITQGLDTLSVTQQAFVNQKPLGVLEATKKIYISNGVYGFFKGGAPRGVRTISAVTIMSIVNEKAESLLQKKS